MDREVLPSRLVQDAIKQFVPVRVDAWKELDVTEKYQVFSTPMYAVLDSTGKMVLRADGYLSAEDFVSFLQAGGSGAKAPPE